LGRLGAAPHFAEEPAQDLPSLRPRRNDRRQARSDNQQDREATHRSIPLVGQEIPTFGCADLAAAPVRRQFAGVELLSREKSADVVVGFLDSSAGYVDHRSRKTDWRKTDARPIERFTASVKLTILPNTAKLPLMRVGSRADRASCAVSVDPGSPRFPDR
jgi:hypothetical protein